MQTKELFRKQSLLSLKKQSLKNNYAGDKKINKQILHIVKKQKPKNVLVYLPLKIEANIMFAIAKMRRSGVNVFVPFVQDISFKMVPFRLPLKRGRFDLKHANNSFQRIKKIDIAFVPAVGIDVEFKRVGFGKGMYDRFFANFAVPLVIFVSRLLCLSKVKVSNEFDSSGHMLVTAHKNYIQGYSTHDNRTNGVFDCSSVGICRVLGRQKNRSSQIRHLCRAIKV